MHGWPSLVSLSWLPGQCRKSDLDPWVLECSGPAQPQEPDGNGALLPWPYSTSTFITYRQRQTGVDREFDSRRMTWTVETQGSTYFLGFNFMADQCNESDPG